MREYASIIYEAFVYHFKMAETVEASAFCFTENILPKKATVSTETAEKYFVISRKTSLSLTHISHSP